MIGVVIAWVVLAILSVAIIADAAFCNDIYDECSEELQHPPKSPKDMGRYEREIYENFCAIRGWNPFDESSWKVWASVRKQHLIFGGRSKRE